jgi:hypothetical protein
MAVKCGLFPKKPLIRSIPLSGKSFERHLDPPSPQGAWRIRYNDEIYKMYTDVAFSTNRCLKRLMWAGHVVRMEEDRIPKVPGSCYGREKPVGRQRNRWEDVIQRDAANLLHIRNWKAAARGKEEWRKKVGEAMARKRAEEEVPGLEARTVYHH